MSKTSKILIKRTKQAIGLESSTQSVLTIRLLGLLVKVVLAGAALTYVGYKVYHRSDVLSLLNLRFEVLTLKSLFISFLLPSVLLMISNWWIEVLKWKMLLKKEVEISNRTAIKGVLTGTTVGVFSPNRVGEFLGRVLALAPNQRIKGSLLSFVNGVAQTIATYTFGTIGLLVLIEQFAIDSIGFVASRVLQVLLILGVLLVLFLYTRTPLLNGILPKSGLMNTYRHYLSVFSTISTRTLWRVYHLSMLRFLTFILQYFIVFGFIMDAPDALAILSGSVLTLFSSTLIPFLPIPDLLVRESMAMSYFDLYHFDLGLVGIGVFLVWMINVGLPAIMGSSILFTYRIFKAR